MIRYLRKPLQFLSRDGLLIGALGMVLSMILGYWLWQSSHTELAMIGHARTVTATLIGTRAATHRNRDGEGGAEGEFGYRLPDGTEGTITRGYDRLDEIPEVIQVEYLPERPDVKRVKGIGSRTVGEWKFWLGFKYVLIAVWFLGSVWLLRSSIRDG